MALDLLKRSENGAPLSATQHDANLTAIENAFNGISVADRTAMAALNTATGGYTFLKESGREGWFKWDSSNLSAQVTADTQQGVYVAPAAAPTGASGAWVRVYDGLPNAAWFGLSTSLADNTPVLEAAMAVSPRLAIPAGTFTFQNTIDLPSGAQLTGLSGAAATVFQAHASMTTATLLRTVTASGGTDVFAHNNVVLDSITFDGNSRTLATDSFLLNMRSIDGLTVRNCVLKNNFYGLLAVQGSRNVSLSNLEFANWGKTVVSTEGGPALWLAGNLTGGDDTQTSQVRANNLYFHDAEWAAIYDFSEDSAFSNVDIHNVKEGGVYTANFGADGSSAQHHYSGFNVSNVQRKYISSAGFEIWGNRTTISNFTISSTDDAGIKINSGTSGLTITNGHIWDAVRQQATYATYTNYGQIHFSQTSAASKDVAITNVIIGKPGLTPNALHAISFGNSVTVGLHAENISITGNNLVNGFTSAAFYDINDAIDPASSTIAIYDNIGAADYANPFSASLQIARSNFVDGKDLTNSVENGSLEAGDLVWSYNSANWAISNDPANAKSGNYVAINTSTSGTQQSFDSNLSAVETGETVYAEMWLKTSASLTATNIRVQILWYDKDAVFLSTSSGTNYTTAQLSYVLSSLTATAPANAVQFKVRALAQKTVGTVYVDAISAFRKRDATKLLTDKSVTYPLLPDIATASFLGRNTAGTGNVEVLSLTTVNSMLEANAFAKRMIATTMRL